MRVPTRNNSDKGNDSRELKPILTTLIWSRRHFKGVR